MDRVYRLPVQLARPDARARGFRARACGGSRFGAARLAPVAGRCCNRRRIPQRQELSMQRSMTGSILGLAIVLASASAAFNPAAAGEVYQWKDAKGVNHYSESPPPKGAYKQRAISEGGQAQATQQVATAAAPAETAQCTAARKNMEVLNGTATVQQDTDGDGKPDKTLNDADRANQLELAQVTIKATCITATDKP
jgi:Domain of unknown function (DUF4124)